MDFIDDDERPTTVMVHGETGSGKSTFVESLCQEKGLNAVCIDLANTNFTSIPRVKIDLSNHIKARISIIRAIEEVKKDSHYDTVVIDGYTRLMTLFLGEGKGLSKFSERSEQFKKLENALFTSGLNWVVIGQPDMRAREETEDGKESAKPIISINELVNEQYHCTYDRGKFYVECEKNRDGSSYDKREVTRRG